MTRALETLEPIQGTLSEINKRTPEVGVSKFVTRALQTLGTEHVPPAREDGDAGHGRRAERPDARPCALRMDWAACVLPRHGEDAHFGHAEAGFIGVADGVGGYRRRGVDAGAFARQLMASALAKVELAARPGKVRRLRPEGVLERAYESMVIRGTPGASTAVVLSLHRSTLRWAYIGDSAFAVLRGGRIVHRSTAQQRRFNCPYQLNADDRGDSLDEAEVGGMPVEDGDVVVAGTDGLFDNVRDDQLARAVQMGTELGFSPKNMADIIAAIAYDVSKSKLVLSPFSLAYRKAYGERSYYGGKKDDITVIVAYIVPKNS